MRMTRIRQYYGEVRDQVSQYLSQDLWLSLIDISRVLSDITFSDNFKGWIERDVVIPAGSDVAISNKLRPDIPSQRIILRSNQSRIRDGDVAWDEKNVYLHNDESSDAIVTVLFLK